MVAACASSSGGAPSGSRDVLTEQQLSAYTHLNAYDAIRQTRPQWLRSGRGQSSLIQSSQDRRGIRVYVDGVPMGDAAALRTIDTRTVAEMQFLDAREATLKYGTNHSEGAILVTTRS